MSDTMKKRRAKLIQLSEALAREGEEERAAAVIDLLPQDEAEWLQDLIEYQKARQVGGSQASTPAAKPDLHPHGSLSSGWVAKRSDGTALPWVFANRKAAEYFIANYVKGDVAEAQRAGEAGGLPDRETDELPAPPPAPEGRIKAGAEVTQEPTGWYIVCFEGRDRQFFNDFGGFWARDIRDATSFPSSLSSAARLHWASSAAAMQRRLQSARAARRPYGRSAHRIGPALRRQPDRSAPPPSPVRPPMSTSPHSTAR